MTHMFHFVRISSLSSNAFCSTCKAGEKMTFVPFLSLSAQTAITTVFPVSRKYPRTREEALWCYSIRGRERECAWSIGWCDNLDGWDIWLDPTESYISLKGMENYQILGHLSAPHEYWWSSFRMAVYFLKRAAGFSPKLENDHHLANGLSSIKNTFSGLWNASQFGAGGREPIRRPSIRLGLSGSRLFWLHSPFSQFVFPDFVTLALRPSGKEEKKRKYWWLIYKCSLFPFLLLMLCMLEKNEEWKPQRTNVPYLTYLFSTP